MILKINIGYRKSSSNLLYYGQFTNVFSAGIEPASDP